MNAAMNLLHELHRAAIEVTAAGDRLQVSAPAGAITPELRATLTAEKQNLLPLLADPRRAPRRAWLATVQAVSGRWKVHAGACRAMGREPGWLDEAVDARLQLSVGEAIRSGELPDAIQAMYAWRTAWDQMLVPAGREAIHADRESSKTPWAIPSPEAGTSDPGNRCYPRKFPTCATGVGLTTWLDEPEFSDEDRAAFQAELRSRTSQMIAESDGLRPPPNPSVHSMFAEARERFGTRDSEARSITGWIRQHAPAVAALWPEAPWTAAWIDWRGRVQPEHVPVLDEAWRACSTPLREVKR